jgi:hypothetical protein
MDEKMDVFIGTFKRIKWLRVTGNRCLSVDEQTERSWNQNENDR